MASDMKRMAIISLACVLSFVLASPAARANGAEARIEDKAPGIQSLNVGAVGDDDIPGVAGAVSPINGWLSANLGHPAYDIDENDVYAIDLAAGQAFQGSISGDYGDFDLYLYGPDASSVFVNQPLAGADGAVYPDSFLYTVPTTGTYYLVASAQSGFGDYTITITETIPPIVNFEPVTRYDGRTATVTITGADTGGAGLTSITYSLDSRAPTTTTSAKASVVVTRTGAHTLTASATDGCGNTSAATMNFTVALPTSLDLSCPRNTPVYDERVTLSATLRNAVRGFTIGSTRVTFERQSGASWVSVGTGYADAYGVAKWTGTPFAKAKTTYRAVFEGVTRTGVVYAASTSERVVVTPSVLLTKPNAPAMMYTGKARPTAGYLRPRHTAGSYPVRIYKYRYVGGKWTSYGYVRAKAANYRTYTKYSKSLSLPSKGRWRLRAHAPGDTKHIATWSTYDYVTVK